MRKKSQVLKNCHILKRLGPIVYFLHIYLITKDNHVIMF